MITRRRLLEMGAVGVGAAAVTTFRSVAFAADEKPDVKPVEKPQAKKIPIALQLYSVRRECAKDKGKALPGILAELKKMGYEGVEFAGYYGWKPADLRKLLDDSGLKAAGTHTGLNALLGDALKATVDLHKTLGCKFIIVPGMGGKYVGSADNWKATAKLYNEIAAKLKPEGLYTGYHCHGGDMKKIGETTGWEVFFDNTDKDVVMQLDTGNCLSGGGDPVALLKKYPGRARTVHMKEHGSKPGGKGMIGEGNVDWKQVISLCRTTAGTEWYVVEHERYPVPAMECVRLCLENLRKLIGECEA